MEVAARLLVAGPTRRRAAPATSARRGHASFPSAGLSGAMSDLIKPGTMNSLPSLVLSAALPAVLVCTIACGDDTSETTGGSTTSGGGGTGGVDDGKYHPPGNGVAQAEAAACKTVADAFQARVTALACVATAPSCPNLIQAPSGAESCSSYDEGTAQGCADYVTAAADCAELKVRLADCIVEPVDGSAPGGCPG